MVKKKISLRRILPSPEKPSSPGKRSSPRKGRGALLRRFWSIIRACFGSSFHPPWIWIRSLFRFLRSEKKGEGAQVPPTQVEKPLNLDQQSTVADLDADMRGFNMKSKRRNNESLNLDQQAHVSDSDVDLNNTKNKRKNKKRKRNKNKTAPEVAHDVNGGLSFDTATIKTMPSLDTLMSETLRDNSGTRAKTKRKREKETTGAASSIVIHPECFGHEAFTGSEDFKRSRASRELKEEKHAEVVKWNHNPRLWAKESRFCSSQHFTVASFNVCAHVYELMSSSSKVEKDWLKRMGLIMEEITSFGADVVCLQEVEPDLLTFLEQHLVEYTFIFFEKNQRSKIEGLAILLKSSWGFENVFKKRLVFHSGSLTVAGLLRFSKGGTSFCIATTHFKVHDSSEAKSNQIIMLLEEMAEANCSVQVITGDFNDNMNGKCRGTLISHHFKSAYNNPMAVDYIYYNKGLRLESVLTIPTERNHVSFLASDHVGRSARFSL